MDIFQQFLIPLGKLKEGGFDADSSLVLFKVSPNVYDVFMNLPEIGRYGRKQFVPEATPHEAYTMWGINVEVDSNLSGGSCELIYALCGIQTYPFNVELEQ